jgi:hypothetical protein
MSCVSSTASANCPSSIFTARRRSEATAMDGHERFKSRAQAEWRLKRKGGGSL